jgi:shikimate kinase
VTIERVLLWGFMASGKTAVGTRLAARLGWQHIDLDDEIVRRAGRPIAEIFAGEGEAAFRILEEAASREVIGRERVVISPGGGWITRPQNLAQIPDGTLRVWLRVDPETVLQRLSADPGAAVRPLLTAPDPAERVRTLLAEREALYRRADHTVRSDGRTVESIVEEIAALVVPPLSVSQRRSESSDG